MGLADTASMRRAGLIRDWTDDTRAHLVRFDLISPGKRIVRDIVEVEDEVRSLLASIESTAIPSWVESLGDNRYEVVAYLRRRSLGSGIALVEAGVTDPEDKDVMHVLPVIYDDDSGAEELTQVEEGSLEASPSGPIFRLVFESQPMALQVVKVSKVSQ